MTKQEIETAAKDYSTNERKDELRNDSFYDGMYSGRIFGFISGATMVNEKQPYSKDDALNLTKFAITMLASNLSYNVAKDMWLWWNETEWVIITDEELIKLWEDSKNG